MSRALLGETFAEFSEGAILRSPYKAYSDLVEVVQLEIC